MYRILLAGADLDRSLLRDHSCFPDANARPVPAGKIKAQVAVPQCCAERLAFPEPSEMFCHKTLNPMLSETISDDHKFGITKGG